MYGLVLGGGGSRGAYGAGAYEALRDLEITISAVTGTSIGAINGAMIAQGEFEKMKEMWHTTDTSAFIDVEKDYLKQVEDGDITLENISYFINKGIEIVKNKGVSTAKMMKLLDDMIDEDKLRNSKINYGVVTVAVDKLDPVEISIDRMPKGTVKKYIMASASLPGFKSPAINGVKHVDGGVYDNLPINLMRNMGYNKVIAVNLGPMYRKRSMKGVILISPREDLGGILDFNPKRSAYRYELGYYDTLRVFKNLKGQEYYIKSNLDKKYYRRLLLDISDSSLKKICKIHNVKDIPCERALYEVLIPRTIEILNLDRDSSYETVILAIYEEIAKYLKIDKFKVYDALEFMELVKEKYAKVKKTRKESIFDFMKRKGFIMKHFKDEILQEIMDILIEDK